MQSAPQEASLESKYFQGKARKQLVLFHDRICFERSFDQFHQVRKNCVTKVCLETKKLQISIKFLSQLCLKGIKSYQGSLSLALGLDLICFRKGRSFSNDTVKKEIQSLIFTCRCANLQQTKFLHV